MIQLKNFDILTIYLCITVILYVPYLKVYTFIFKLLSYASNIPEERFRGTPLNSVTAAIIRNFSGFFNRKVNGIIMRWKIVYRKSNAFQFKNARNLAHIIISLEQKKTKMTTRAATCKSVAFCKIVWRRRSRDIIA